MTDDAILKAIETIERKLTEIDNYMGRGFGEIQRQIDDLDDKVEEQGRSIAVLQQDVTRLRTQLVEVVGMGPKLGPSRLVQRVAAIEHKLGMVLR